MEVTGRLRILFIIDSLYGLHGGTENQVVKLINHIDRSLFDIHLLHLSNSRWIDAHASELNCKLKCYDVMKLKRPKNIILFLLILRYIRRLRPDVVMTFFALSNILGVAIARMAGVKCIVGTRRDYGLWLGKGLVFFRLANRLVQRILTNSYRVRDLIAREEQFDKSRIDVIYNGIRLKEDLPDARGGKALKAKWGIPEGAPVVGIVGGLKPMKRHGTFIRAAKRIRETRADVHFLIIGDGPLRNRLERLAAHLGMTAHMHFAGSQEDVLPFLGILDIGINCSANEGLSNAIMEYMAYGVPCIASRAGGNAELIKDGENGCLFDLDDDSGLAESIESLLEDKERSVQFAQRSREKIIGTFSLERMIEQYNQYFTKVFQASM